MRLQLHQRVAAPADVRRRCEMQHQSFATTGDDVAEGAGERLAIGDPTLRRALDLPRAR